MVNVVIFADNYAFSNLPITQKIRPSIRSAGSYRIATEVRKMNLSCQVVELMTEFSDSEIELLCKKFVSDQTLIVGFNTTFWYYNHPVLKSSIKTIIQCIRDINSRTKIIFGGPNSLRLIQDEPYDIDAVFLGYAEHYFIKYLNNLISNKSLPFPSKIKNNIKIYDFVEHSDVFQFCQSQIIYDQSDCLFDDEPVAIEVGRGCIFKCKFCSYPLTGKKKLDHIKDQDIIKDELIRNFENYNINKYIISDDTFNDSNEKLEKLHRVFSDLPFKINFACYLRIDLLNARREQIEMLEDMGLVAANFGIESFHERAARSIGKGISPDVSKKLLYDLKSQYWKDRVKIQINLISGLPYETMDSYEETKKWILSEDECLIESVDIAPLGIRNPKFSHNVWLTEFERNSEKYGYYWKENDIEGDWYNDIQPTKSRQQAVEIQKYLTEATVLSNRTLQGGFKLFGTYIARSFLNDKKTLDEQIKMNRHEFKNWLTRENNNGQHHILYINSYKQKIFNL